MSFQLFDWLGLRLEVLGGQLVPSSFESEDKALQWALKNSGEGAIAGQLTKIQWKGCPAVWKQNCGDVVLQSAVVVRPAQAVTA